MFTMWWRRLRRLPQGRAVKEQRTIKGDAAVCANGHGQRQSREVGSHSMSPCRPVMDSEALRPAKAFGVYVDPIEGRWAATGSTPRILSGSRTRLMTAPRPFAPRTIRMPARHRRPTNPFAHRQTARATAPWRAVHASLRSCRTRQTSSCVRSASGRAARRGLRVACRLLPLGPTARLTGVPVPADA